ncbi:sporulation protein YjcZ [Paenibacillus glycinis]|uniref:Sporulation protein YjcZ n=1 Tax=Paenibacillus glycinis TaxID=2697035 RepID=A0ABW9XST5_9BACL|nr:sporulation protein YjcZ [Paenibacillus glycinis]NBD25421.1 sporulation protein YjcZ [Paenibacillus glycinis]
MGYGLGNVGGVGQGCGPVGGIGLGGGFAGIILVLFILLVIISRPVFC